MEITHERPTVGATGLKYGLIGGLIAVAFNLIVAVTGNNPYESKYDWKFFTGIAISLVIVYLAHKEFKDKGDGFMSFGQGLGIGMILGIVSTVIFMVYTYVYMKFVDAALMEDLINKAIEDMEKKGAPEQNIEMMVKYFEMFFWIILVVAGLFMSFIYALIVSLFTKKSNPQPEF